SSTALLARGDARHCRETDATPPPFPARQQRLHRSCHERECAKWLRLDLPLHNESSNPREAGAPVAPHETLLPLLHFACQHRSDEAQPESVLGFAWLRRGPA